MTEFLFGFRDLTNVTDPKTPIINLGSLVLTDTFVRKFNPKRYNFYIKYNIFRFMLVHQIMVFTIYPSVDIILICISYGLCL